MTPRRPHGRQRRRGGRRRGKPRLHKPPPDRKAAGIEDRSRSRSGRAGCSRRRPQMPRRRRSRKSRRKRPRHAAKQSEIDRAAAQGTIPRSRRTGGLATIRPPPSRHGWMPGKRRKTSSGAAEPPESRRGSDAEWRSARRRQPRRQAEIDKARAEKTRPCLKHRA